MNITGVGIFGHTTYNSGNEVSFSLSGTFSADMEFVYSINSGATWQTIWSGSSAVSDSRRIDTESGGSFIAAWKCDTYRSGTVVALQSSGGDNDVAAGTLFISAASLTDISSKLIDAQSALPSGGKIVLPPGTFYVQNVPLIDGIYYEGAGETATQLKLPNGATHSMFVAAADLTIGWGFRNIYFSGIYNSTIFGQGNAGGKLLTRSAYNCIDCTACTNVYKGNIENCWFEYFNKGYAGAAASGTNFDWYVEVLNCCFQYNNTGATFSEHLHIAYSYFFFNGTTNGSALTGGGAMVCRPNDFVMERSWVGSNYAGLVPAASASVNNVQILGCGFFTNQTYDMTLTSDCVVNGCTFWADQSFTTYAIIINGVGRITIAGNKFNEATVPYKGGLVRFFDNAAVIGFLNITFSSNILYCNDSTAGPVFDLTGVTNNSSTVYCVSIVGNTGLFNRTQLVKNGANNCFWGNWNLNGNSWTFNGDYTAATAVAWMNCYGGDPYPISINDVFYIGSKLVLINGTFGSGLSWIGGSFISAGAVATPTVAAALFAGGTYNVSHSIQNVRGIKTRNSGSAVFSAATTVAVTHGLAFTPSIADISLDPQFTSATVPWVSNITSTQFTINFAGSMTGSVSWIASVNN